MAFQSNMANICLGNRYNGLFPMIMLFLWEGNHCYFRYPLTLANWILVVSVDISTVNSQILYGVAFLFIIMIFIMYLAGKIVFVMAKNIIRAIKRRSQMEFTNSPQGILIPGSQ